MISSSRFVHPRRLILTLVALAACSPSQPAAGTSATEPGASLAEPKPSASAEPAHREPPRGWFAARTVSGSDQSAMAIRCAQDELVFVSTRRAVRIRSARLEEATADRWRWSLEPGITCTLEEQRLTCSDGSKVEAFALEPIADAARSAELDALLAADRPSDDICVRAEACGHKTFAIVAARAKFDVDTELGNPRDPEKCQGALEGLRSILETKSADVPVECR